MTWIKELGAWVGAGAVVAAIAFAPAWTSAEAKTPKEEREIPEKKVKQFELFSNSMDVFGPADIVSCFSYRCSGVVARALGTPDVYELVRTVHVGQMFPSPCDEILFRVDPALFVSRTAQTRWMRMTGPAGLPFGCFDGRLEIGIRVEGGGAIPLFVAALEGTTGLRPAMADPTINMEDPQGTARCRRPSHDEGCYVGRFSRKGVDRLVSIARPGLELSNAELKQLRKAYLKCTVAGTFEGSLETFDETYCAIRSGQWWYDGMMKCPCKEKDTITSRVPPVDVPR